MALRGLVAGTIGMAVLALTAPAAAQIPGRTQNVLEPPQEYSETYKDWKLYCQVWPSPKRIECEIATRLGTGSNPNSRLVWLRSSDRWLDGLRFRLDPALLSARNPIRLWIDNDLFRPEFPCTPFAFEPNTCAVADPKVTRELAESMKPANKVSAVGLAPDTGRKATISFPLAGFTAAVERTEQLREEAGVPWSVAR